MKHVTQPVEIPLLQSAIHTNCGKSVANPVDIFPVRRSLRSAEQNAHDLGTSSIYISTGYEYISIEWPGFPLSLAMRFLFTAHGSDHKIL
jgi:hypothetical protein